jgi:hypothetical protein
MTERAHERHFTLEEARGTLTEIHAIVTRLVELKKRLDVLGWDVRRHRFFGGRGPNGDGSFPADMETLVDVVRSLEGRGVVVSGLDEGLVDFPFLRRDGEELYLCWKLGENDILSWHSRDAGFAGRRPVEEL